MKKDIKLTFEDSKVVEIFRGTTVRDVLRELDDETVIALKVNGIILNADAEITEDGYVSYIRTYDRIGRKIYTKGLEHVYIKSVKNLFGESATVRIKHSIDKGIYTEIETLKELDANVVLNIKNEMKRIVSRNLPFRSVSVIKDDLCEYVKSKGELEKLLNYRFIINESLTMYELEDDYNYFFYFMPPSTGCLKRFDLTYIAPNGVVLSFPVDNIVPKFKPSPKVLEAFKDSEKKLKGIGVSYSGDVNKIVSDGKVSDFIQLNEILYNDNLQNIVNKVCENKSIKSIFISGPSSSGKTTTSKKLSMYLKAKGIDTLVISTDDYYKERVDSPKKEDGSYEFESIEALDYKLFSNHLKKILDGESVVMPTFNFITGEKEYKNKPISLSKKQVLIVEGLHAISEELNGVIPKKNKLKLYISPFTPIGIDRHNHISTTDVRLLRRLVRDYLHRGYSAEQTLTSWMGMRESEQNYVFPHQREADYIVNTSLGYEIGVLRTYAEPLLYSIDPTSMYYDEAIRILKFLKEFLNIPCDLVPNTSVLREFIGNSYYE